MAVSLTRVTAATRPLSDTQWMTISGRFRPGSRGCGSRHRALLLWPGARRRGARSRPRRHLGADGLGATTVSVDVPSLKLTMTTGVTLLLAEGAASHLHWLRERPSDYFPETRQSLELGALLPWVTVDAAQRARALISSGRWGRPFAAIDSTRWSRRPCAETTFPLDPVDSGEGRMWASSSLHLPGEALTGLPALDGSVRLHDRRAAGGGGLRTIDPGDHRAADRPRVSDSAPRGTNTTHPLRHPRCAVRARPAGFEPATSASGGQRSIH